jgi:hypothetical protein
LYKSMIAIIIFVLFLIAGPTDVQAGQTTKTPWRLAVVVEHSTTRDQALGGTQGRQALRQALQMELRTLPLRIQAGVWLAKESGPVSLVKPGPAVNMRGLKLNLLQGQGKTRLEPALAQAIKWLEQHGGGSLLIIAASPPQKWGPPQDKGIFSHAVSLGQKAKQKDFSDLTIKGGGALWNLTRAQAAPTLIRQAVTTAISPVSLVFLSRDQDNQPRQTTLTVKKIKSKESLRRVATLRPAQIKPGTYKLSWPSGSGIAPGPLPDKVTVGFEGQTRVWVGGTGSLGLKALDAQGQELNWQLQITRVVDGEVVKQWHIPPSQNQLPSGIYIVNSRSPRHSWLVELGAGQKKELLAGPKGWLNILQPGPSGPVRTPYQVYDFLSGRRVATGYTGNRIRLMPGRYRLEFELPPGASREITMQPQGKKELSRSLCGGLLLLVQGAKKTFTLLDVQDKELAQGMPGRVLHLMPGRYRVVTWADQSRHDVTVRAGEITELKIKPN